MDDKPLTDNELRALLARVPRVGTPPEPGLLGPAEDNPVSRVREQLDRARDDERCDDRRQRGGRRHGEDLHVVAHVEHDPSRQQHGSERKQHGEEGQPDELEPDGRKQPKQIGERKPDGERRQCDEDGVCDHGASL